MTGCHMSITIYFKFIVPYVYETCYNLMHNIKYFSICFFQFDEEASRLCKRTSNFLTRPIKDRRRRKRKNGKYKYYF